MDLQANWNGEVRAKPTPGWVNGAIRAMAKDPTKRWRIWNLLDRRGRWRMLQGHRPFPDFFPGGIVFFDSPCLVLSFSHSYCLDPSLCIHSIIQFVSNFIKKLDYWLWWRFFLFSILYSMQRLIAHGKQFPRAVEVGTEKWCQRDGAVVGSVPRCNLNFVSCDKVIQSLRSLPLLCDVACRLPRLGSCALWKVGYGRVVISRFWCVVFRVI